MASARGANSASDGYSRFNDDFDNIEGSYQSNNISKLNNHMLIISITLILYCDQLMYVIFDTCDPLPVV